MLQTILHRCELLKSLVLPGLGAFTIVDERKVGGEDVGNNFFLDYESVGENRGVVATRLLVEMNHEVRGDAVEDSPEDILRNKPGTVNRPTPIKCCYCFGYSIYTYSDFSLVF